ncbi:hypothetical protein GCM10010303_06750 [Streptomyces purpurascens]|nr:hypothetical protein GCM10010303_06750 [Streptomyces purpurascens]
MSAAVRRTKSKRSACVGPEEAEATDEETGEGDAEGDTDTGAVLEVLMRVRTEGASAGVESAARAEERRMRSQQDGRHTQPA